MSAMAGRVREERLISGSGEITAMLISFNLCSSG
jgi:hypothetical protein